jgi:hypothetical protein
VAGVTVYGTVLVLWGLPARERRALSRVARAVLGRGQETSGDVSK